MSCFGSILLKKSANQLDPIFSAPQARHSEADMGDLIFYSRV